MNETAPDRGGGGGPVVRSLGRARPGWLADHRSEEVRRWDHYDRGRRQLASTTVDPPAVGRWHTVCVAAVGDRIQGYLNGKLFPGSARCPVSVRPSRPV